MAAIGLFIFYLYIFYDKDVRGYTYKSGLTLAREGMYKY